MHPQTHTSATTNHCFRLRPGQDLKKELLYYCQTHRLHAAVVACSVGSLNKAHLRLPGGKEVVEFHGPFEIISLNGTLGLEGVHLHIGLSNFEGRMVGGHLMDGCEVHTTVEVILLENQELIFHREIDGHTGYKELVIKRRI